MEFNNSETSINLMRAFAGESQARNRYTFAATQAKKLKLPVLEYVFKLTASQEKAHAEIFYNFLKELNGKNIEISNAAYPVDVYDDVIKLLETSHHNEFEEFDSVYPTFAQIANEEGFKDIGAKFNMIAKIEEAHGKRFNMFAELMKTDKLFKSDKKEKWFCINCGNIHESSEAPRVCPVCGEEQGYYVRLDLAPYSNDSFLTL